MDNHIGFWRRFITIALLFVLLSEWMRPLSMMSDVTGIYMIEPLLFTLAAVMLTDLFSLPVILTWIIKMLIILSLSAAAHSSTHLANFDWWRSFAQELPQDIMRMIQMDWGYVSPELRTSLFLLSWAIIASCLMTAVLLKRFVLWFIGGTAVYLLVLSWWPGLDTFAGIVRVIGAGVLLHAVHVPVVLLRRTGTRVRLAQVPLTWSVSIVMLVALTIGIGYATAERMGDREPIESAAVWEMLHVQSWFGANSVIGDQAKGGITGYGTDDADLGGSLQSDDAPAFLAVNAYPDTYYRGEAKLIYDGKGWHGIRNELYRYELDTSMLDLRDDNSMQVVKKLGEQWDLEPEHIQHSSEYIFLIDEEWLARLNADRLVDEKEWRVSHPKGQYGLTPIFAGGPVTRLDAAKTTAMDQMNEGFIAVDRLESNYYLGGLGEPLASYQVRTARGDERAVNGVQSLSEEELAAALQVPDDLPSRVRELSAGIVKRDVTDAEKAKSIATYLKEHYTYTLTPPAGKKTSSTDFVDRFLFEQMAGYCDYFSSAMVIMLRSVGVPARWVKGFAPGEPVGAAEHKLVAERIALIEPDALASDPSMSITLVRNSDAHSWVEVFLPGQGWTAFEPTPGISATGVSIAQLADDEVMPAMAQHTELEQQTSTSKSIFHAAASSMFVQVRQWSKPFIGWIDAAIRDRELQVDYVRGVAAAVTLCLLLLLLQVLRTPSNRLRLQLAVYACGIGGIGADARLLKRIVEDVVRDGQHGSSPGETLREVVSSQAVLAESPPRANLTSAISLYEQLCYGPPRVGRIPSKQMLSIYKATRG